ncbi:universal stress protein [Streptacidiphilus neutrinimicus]|uniref:universal stress protein n=1 Tax=Streptacidiphilus neutrinimicus TaxID=105420 RepID=UPI0005A9BB19|nr:universal stress protein [Streptacidiphilus neutrinimicus]
MAVVVWITEGTWPACVDAARAYAPPEAEIVLLHVLDTEASAVAHGAFVGLLGRAHPVTGHRPATGWGRDPGDAAEQTATVSERNLFQAAADRIGRPCSRQTRAGRAEREVVAAADGADLLVLARDGDLRHLGPHSLGRATRFVVDHAPCPILLVWPQQAPDVTTLPPPPPPR